MYAIINIELTTGETFRKDIEIIVISEWTAFQNIQQALKDFFSDWEQDNPMNIKSINIESETTGKILFKAEY